MKEIWGSGMVSRESTPISAANLPHAESGCETGDQGTQQCDDRIQFRQHQTSPQTCDIRPSVCSDHAVKLAGEPAIATIRKHRQYRIQIHVQTNFARQTVLMKEVHTASQSVSDYYELQIWHPPKTKSRFTV